MVRKFMEQRVAARGAEKFLDADGLEIFRPGGALSPLYPKPRIEEFEIVFLDDLGDGTYEVGVRLVFETGSYGDTLFVQRTERGLIVSGGRPGTGRSLTLMAPGPSGCIEALITPIPWPCVPPT
jgi:hypothetical protein